MLKLTLYGAPVTKKNSGQIWINQKTNKPFIAPSNVNQGVFQSLQFVLWQDVKHDKAADQAKLDEVYNAAFACACECAQVMAMCLKWGESFEHSKE